MTLRLPPESIALLDAIARAVGRQRWKVVAEAIDAYAGTAPALTPEDQRAVRELRRRDDLMQR